jgi:hypothetical protein
MKHAGILHLSGGITRPFEPDKKRTCVKKGIGLQAYELPGVRDREPLLKRVPPLLMECSIFMASAHLSTSKLAQTLRSFTSTLGGLEIVINE